MTALEPERRITALERQKRNPERVNLSLDGAFAMGLPLNAVADFGLRVGKTLTPAQIEDRLKRKQFDDETIDRVITRLRDWRYIDDEAFARYWVENRESNRPRGRRLLEHELRLKGVDRDTVAEAIDDAEIDERTG